MKKTITTLLCLLVFVACKKEKTISDKIKDSTEKVSKTAKDISDVKSVIGGMDEAKALTAKLKKATPITKEDWKSWMPEKVLDLERTSFKLNQSYTGKNVTIMKLQFKDLNDNSKQFKMDIIDCASEGAGIAYMYKMKASMKLDAESDRGYEKIHTRDGVPLQEKHTIQKHGTKTKMEFLMDDRYAIDARANNIEPDEFWKIINALNFDDLK